MMTPAMRHVPGLVLLLAALAVQPAPASAQGGLPGGAGPSAVRACGAPDDLLNETLAPLPATARAVQAGRLAVLVGGSASVFGPGTSEPAQAWPVRLQALLAQRWPGLSVVVTVRGGRGLTAADSAGLIAAELPALRPDLVIWQAGTVEAVRGLEPEVLTETLDAGLERVAAAGADLILVDQQFSRFLRANTNIEPYRDAIRLVAAAHGVALLRRYELMRFWAETDRVDLERAPRELRAHVADRLNACLAEALAVLIRRGVVAARDKGTTAPRP